jgi:predicted GNAT family acetyltransferase
MAHLLDNPAFNALISGNKDLGNGNETVRYYHKDISPFIGMTEPTKSNFDILHQITPTESVSGFISPIELQIPSPWKIARLVKVFQMIFEKSVSAIKGEKEIIPLSDEHIPQMLELTKLTNPGPFSSRTIDFGYYRGIFDGDKLIAMAGQRMHPFNYAEISAVCTHPDYLGKGYARQLLMNQAHRIQQADEIPFLHVLTDNERAINVYKDLGFTIRTELSIYIIHK